VSRYSNIETSLAMSTLVSVHHTWQTLFSRSAWGGLRSAAVTNYVARGPRTKFGQHAFLYAEPAAWNQLPETIRQPQTWALFKKCKI